MCRFIHSEGAQALGSLWADTYDLRSKPVRGIADDRRVMIA